MSETNAERLGHRVRLRRAQLRIHTAKALADRAHVTPRLVSDLEGGRRTNFSGSTKAAIEDVLLWEPGSIDITLTGGEPIPLETAPADQRPNRMHPSLKAGVPIEVVAESFSDIIRNISVMEGNTLAINDMVERLRPHGSVNFPSEDEVETVKANAMAGNMELRSFLNDEIVKMIATSYADNADEVVKLFAPLLTEVTKPPIRSSETQQPASSPPGVTSLADRRPVPPPPDTDDLDVAASRREKQSDGDRDEGEDGPYELSLFNIQSGLRTKREFASGAEAYEYAREFLISEGEKPHLVDAALGDAGQHIADTSAEGYGVRIRKIVDRSAALDDDDK